MKQWFLAHLVLAGVLLSIAACRSKAESWQRIQDAGELSFGLDPTYPPFESISAGELQGLDVDLARALSLELALRPKFVQFGFDGLYDALATGQVDVLLSALQISADKTEDFAYSEPYFNAGVVLLSPIDQPLNALTELAQGNVAVELGSHGHVAAISAQRQLPDLTVDAYNSGEEAMSAVLEMRAEAALVDGISGRLFAAESDKLRVTEEPVTDQPFALVVRSDERQLLTALNSALRALRDSGKLDELIASWLGQTSVFKINTLGVN